MTDTPDVTPPQADGKPKRRFRMGCLGWCVCAFFLLILACVGVKHYAQLALQAKVDALQAAGEPVTWDEVLARIEPIPDEENSALVLLPALNSIDDWAEPQLEEIVDVWSMERGVRPSDEMLRLMRKLVAANSAALATLHEAAKRPHGRWPTERGPRGFYRESESYRLKDGVRLLQIEAGLRAGEGDAAGAAQSVFAILRMGASLDGSPHLGSQRDRLSHARGAGPTLEAALALLEMSAQDLAMLRKEFTTEAQQNGMRTAFQAGRVEFLNLISERRFDHLESAGFVAKALFCVPGVFESDIMYGLEFLKKEIAVLDLPPREQMARARMLMDDRRARTFSKECDCCTNRHGLDSRWYASLLYCPELAVAALCTLHDKQELHIARAALAVEQFRVEHKRWPEKLADLVPKYLDAVPQDWHAPAGSTIKYMRTPTGVRLWSVDQSYVKNLAGLTGAERSDLWRLAHDIREFAKAEGRLPKSLAELVPDTRESIPVDGRTGKPFSYVPAASGSDSFVLGGFADGMAEGEYWKRRLATEGWANVHYARFRSTMFCLLNPELRGARQTRLGDEVAASKIDELRDLGYTFDRLKELGFSDDAIDTYFDRYHGREKEEERARKKREQSNLPDALPPDTQVEPVP